MNDNYISVRFEDEVELLESIKAVKKAGLKIYDVFTPFPVHGLDKALEIKPSRIPIVGFICGAIGTITAFFFQSWVNLVDWPINIGGKPFFAVPSFIPVTFEVTILFTAFGMIGAFLYKCNLFSGSKNKIFHDKITDDCFLMVLEYGEKDMLENEKNEIEKMLYNNGAYDIDFVENINNK